MIRFGVEVVNEGPVQGAATVFLFARDVVASIARPVLELKRFAKIALAPGETDVIDFVLSRRRTQLSAARISYPVSKRANSSFQWGSAPTRRG